MRQSHQKSRSRGRNRKPQNPMSRNYESNGPDVKIRGNAGHIAEKYSTLARDALSNGDTVMAENYLQHAEHYNRLIAAAQLQRAEENAANMAANGRGPQPEVAEENSDGAQEKESASEVNAAESSEDSQEESKPRKNGRGRRTKRAPVDTEASSDKQEEMQSTVNGSDDQSTSESESISDDAASLPQSITGGLRVEEA